MLFILAHNQIRNFLNDRKFHKHININLSLECFFFLLLSIANQLKLKDTRTNIENWNFWRKVSDFTEGAFVTVKLFSKFACCLLKVSSLFHKDDDESLILTKNSPSSGLEMCFCFNFMLNLTREAIKPELTVSKDCFQP